MDNTKYLLASLIVSICIVAAGTVGYMLIEGWSLLDALYMTVITLTTVGYGEVQTVSDMGRLFTIGLIFSGVGMILYLASSLVQFMVEGRIRTILGRRRLDNKINRLKNHYIVCGYGRIGRVLCKNMLENPLDLVIVEKDPDLVSIMDEDKVLYVHGDASDESVLISAGINRAKGLVAALATDADNVFLVLTARQLNPDIFIMARTSHKGAESKLRIAGANQVESPYDIGAKSMAHRLLRPTVTSFLDLAFAHSRKDIQMEEIPVSSSSKLVNVMLKDSGIRQQFDLIIVAIKEKTGNMLFNPSFETVLRADETVIAVGENENLLKLEKILNPKVGK